MHYSSWQSPTPPPPVDPACASWLDLLARLIIVAAYRGWAPSDLLHLLGPSADATLRWASATHVLRAEVTLPTQHHWHDFLHTSPAPSRRLGAATMQRWCRKLSSCTTLADAAAPTPHAPITARASREHQRIAALLAKAQSTTFSPEAQALTRKAQQLREKLRQQLAGDATCASTSAVVVRRVYVKAPWVRYQFALLDSIARHNCCAVVLLHRSGIISAFGHPEDLDFTLTLFRVLNGYRDTLMRAAPRTTSTSAATTAFRRAFNLGFCARISAELDEVISHLRSPVLDPHASWHHHSAAVALDRNRATAAAVAAYFPDLTRVSVRSRATTDLFGFFHGTQAAAEYHESVIGKKAGQVARAESIAAVE